VGQTNSGYLETDKNPNETLFSSKATAGSASDRLGSSTSAGIGHQGEVYTTLAGMTS